MRAFITGVNGFVGSRLARLLGERGDEVAGSYVGEEASCPGVRLYPADLLDGSTLRRAIDDACPEVVFHLAGLSHVGESWGRLADYFQVNVLGVENLLDAAAGRTVVFASSAEVYGSVPEVEQPLEEQRQPAPRSPYALTKAAAERLALRAGAVVARSFNLVGPGQAPAFALPSFAAQLAAIRAGRRKPVLRVGNLEARRDFLHVDDGVEAYRLLAERGRRGEIYNLGSGTALSIREALELLLQVSGVTVRIERDPERVRPVDIALLQADTGRLEALGWRRGRSLEEALRDLWAFTLEADGD